MNNTLARMQTLVGEAGARAGEALGLTEDPFSTVVGCRVSVGRGGFQEISAY